ncbi:MAG: T9SS type A sorting domain-containing protein, partial [Bacteroidota bacterium]
NAQAQFAPVGAEWIYNDLDANTQQNTPRGIVSVADTIINGHVCHIVIGDCACGTSQTNFIYGSSGKVYWYNSALNDFTLLYDFNLDEGQTWTVLAQSTISDSLQLQVDSTSVDTINGVFCRVQYIHTVATFGNAYVLEGPLVERVGSRLCLYPQYASCDPPTAGLRCYQDNFLGLYDTHFAPACEDIFIDSGIGIHEIENRNILSLAPNPFHDQAAITLIKYSGGEGILEITDAAGRLVRTGPVNSDHTIIRRGEMEEGIYFYHIRLQEATLSGKFIII